jgi:uncharacterized membrane protein
MKLILWVLIAAVLAASAEALLAALPTLPGTVATHFGAGGRPDGSMSREAFVVFFLAMQAGVVALFAGIGALVPRLGTEFRWLLDAYFAFVAMWLVALVARFRAPRG